MATIKAYTDISQSKVLATILPLESADAFYVVGKEPVDIVPIYGLVTHQHLREQMAYKRAVPCWSLASLLGALPDELTDSDDDVYRNEFFHLKGKYIIQYPKLTTLWPSLFSAESDNPIDACYEMILELHELKML